MITESIIFIFALPASRTRWACADGGAKRARMGEANEKFFSPLVDDLIKLLFE